MVYNENISLAQEFLTKAIDLRKKGLLERAIENYKLSISFFPTAEAHICLAEAYNAEKRYEEAIEECKIAIELDEDYGNSYNFIGTNLMSLGRYDEAVNWFEKAIDAPNNEDRHLAYYNLAKIYEKTGDWFTAIKYYGYSLEIKKDFEPSQSSFINLTALMN